MRKMNLPGAGAHRETNKAGLARFFDVSLTTIDSWIRKGCPAVQRGSLAAPWVFDLLAVAEWRFSGKTGGSPDADPEALPPAERKAWYEGEVKRRDLQERDRELIPAVEVEQVIRTAFAAIAQDIRAIPDNLERRVGISPEVAQAVDLALDGAMEALAERLSNLGTVADQDHE